jgi:predicted DNA-binding transcriptional regulator YafY
MPANKEAFIRYRIIDRMLRNKQKSFPTMEDLVDELEEKLGKTFSESTIQKDIKAMKEDPLLGYNAPIAYHRGFKGYYYEDPSFSIAEIPLSESDIASIEFAATLLQQFKDVKLFSEFGSAADKIFNALNVSTLLDEEQANSIIQFEKVPMYTGSDWIGVLIEHIRDRNVIAIEYRKFDQEDSSRRVLHPYLLKEYRNRWYLLGLPENEKDIRTFALDRIVNIQKAAGKFIMHADFSADDYFRHAYGITTFQGKPATVKLWVSPFSAGYVKTQPLHATQKVLKENEKGIEIELKVGITVELVMDILSFGSNIKVIGPEQLKQQIAEKLEETIRLYKS